MAKVKVILSKAATAILVIFGLVASDSIIRYSVPLYLKANAGERLGALAAILGGIIGAGGAAIAVYLTINGQRKDDAEKVEAALRMEISEFAGFAANALDSILDVLEKKTNITIAWLPNMLVIPEAVVYRAAADRISRLAYGQLFVAFHTRLASARFIAEAYARSPHPKTPGGGAPGPEPIIDTALAQKMGTVLADVCNIGRNILKVDPESPNYAEMNIEDQLTDLDARYARASKLLPLDPDPDPEPKPLAAPRGSATR